MNYKIKLLAAVMAATMLFSACGDNGEESSTITPDTSSTSSISIPSGSEATSTPDASSGSASSGTTTSSSTAPKPVDHYAGLKTNQERLAKAKTLNKDVKAWLTVPGTTIHAPVVQSTNNEYYLKLDEYKNYSIFGSYYFDYENSLTARSNLSKNTIIYGHSDLKDNANGPLFSQLFNYLDKDFLAENSQINLSIGGEDMVFQIFAVYHTSVDFNYIQANPTQAEFQALLEGVNQRNEYLTDVTVGTSDKILTLSTCSATYNTQNPDDIV